MFMEYRTTTHVDVLAACLTITNPAPVSGFLNNVEKLASLVLLTPEPPLDESPTQSVFLNSGDERRNRPCRLSSSNLGESARFSRMLAP